MSFIAWIVVGAIAGFLAESIFHKGDVSGINIESVVIATLGAILVIFVVHLATGSRGMLRR